jgi:release factor glutamine methyltransferase
MSRTQHVSSDSLAAAQSSSQYGVSAENIVHSTADRSASNRDDLSSATIKSARFLGLEFTIATDVLVPREETELLAREAITILRRVAPSGPRVIDMCCGAGNIAVAIAHSVGSTTVLAADITTSCVDNARANVSAHGLTDRVSVYQGDLFAAFETLSLDHSVDLIVCNPPYISSRRLETEKQHLLEHEPREAFDGGPYGLTVHQRVIAAGERFLRDGACLLFEFGVGQARQIELLFTRSRVYEPVNFVLDASGNPRVAIARRRSTR